MDSKRTLCSDDSAELRNRLEKHLTALFSNKTVGKYLKIDGCGTELQILLNFPNHALTFSPIKLAYNIWLGMDATDRYAVLAKFHCLYASLPVIDTGNRKILIFCALFIHELAAILEAAME